MSTDQLFKDQIIAKAWEDESFKEKLLADPKTVIKDTFGIEISDTVELNTVCETARTFYLVIPPAPSAFKQKEPMEIPRWT